MKKQLFYLFFFLFSIVFSICDNIKEFNQKNSKSMSTKDIESQIKIGKRIFFNDPNKEFYKIKFKNKKKSDLPNSIYRIIQKITISNSYTFENFRKDVETYEKLKSLNDSFIPITDCFYNENPPTAYFLFEDFQQSSDFLACEYQPDCIYLQLMVLPPLKRIKLYAKMARSVARLHSIGIVHGNINPSAFYFTDQLLNVKLFYHPSQEKDFLTQENKFLEYYELEKLTNIKKDFINLEKDKNYSSVAFSSNEQADFYALFITIHKIEKFLCFRSTWNSYSEMNILKISAERFFNSVRQEALSFKNYWRDSILLCRIAHREHICIHRIFAQIGVRPTIIGGLNVSMLASILEGFESNESELFTPDFEVTDDFENAVNDHLIPFVDSVFRLNSE